VADKADNRWLATNSMYGFICPPKIAVLNHNSLLTTNGYRPLTIISLVQWAFYLIVAGSLCRKAVEFTKNHFAGGGLK
jgi:hypothetical protein